MRARPCRACGGRAVCPCASRPRGFRGFARRVSTLASPAPPAPRSSHAVRVALCCGMWHGHVVCCTSLLAERRILYMS